MTVCERWRKFDAFLADMGERPRGTTIDRIDASLGYQPGNCRWATFDVQSRNKRNLKLTPDQVAEARRLLADGWMLKDIAARLGCGRQNIGHIKHGRRWRNVAQGE